MPQVDTSDKRVLLSDIRRLTFFADLFTNARRTSSIPSLTCRGAACGLYRPYSVSCTNIGGRGIDINWKCEADLPESLRFRRINVNCEGWSRPDDPYVLEGSCGLTYDLMKVPHLTDDSSFLSYVYENPYLTVFFVLSILVIFSVITSFFDRQRQSSQTNGSSWRPGSWWPWTGSASGGWRGAPPPYSQTPPPHPKHPADASWRPGFWSGLGLGSVASYLWSNRDNRPRGSPSSGRSYDWERPFSGGTFGTHDQGQASGFQTRFSSSSEGFWSGSRSRNSDRGEGPSNLGQMRTASGFARTTVR